MRKALVWVPAVVLAVAPAAAQGGSDAATDSPRYREGQAVTITLTNGSGVPLRMGDTWRIVDARDSSEQSMYLWPEEERTLAPGEMRTWVWRQNQGCYGLCQNPWEGEPSGPGRYEARIPLDPGPTLVVRFDIGAYFELGFDHRPQARFTIFSNRPAIVAALRAEAAAEEKTKIVGGRVRRAAPYNPQWRFSMGPASIRLGDAWIEVCDADPYYVQRNLQEWRGDMWCPWSSRVMAEVDG